MANLFKSIFYNPILIALVFIYNNIAFHDLGLAIIVLTILVRIVLLPVFYKSAKDQAIMRRLEPQIKKIQSDHKNDKTKQAQAMLSLYKEHRFNPFSGIFLLILQLPIFYALFQLFSQEIKSSLFDNHSFLGLINLEQRSLVVVALAGILQYLQGKLSLVPKKASGSQENNSPSNPLASSMRVLVYAGPIFTMLILSNLPAAIGLYWTISTIFSIGQQIYINKKIEI